jgi:hypothetical protein
MAQVPLPSVFGCPSPVIYLIATAARELLSPGHSHCGVKINTLVSASVLNKEILIPLFTAYKI